ncbi:transcriptional corepressor LEUNIG_HOMOLOG isoform X4 [Musa acuminata AAA Group]|uniref:transcriptional corepressor LEUNIG_HOMOLOG isoform X4 n=1 Tax=Musa acuminata AAA Group TaxID=214697 RepID=UPI0031E1D318
MAQSNWEADKMLDVYIYDYLMKRNLQTTAKAFMAEGKVAADPVAIDAPGGFLFEWWSVFWDIFIARTNDKHSEVAAAYIEAQQIKAREHQQQLQMQQLQLMQQRHAQLQRNNPTHPSLMSPVNAVNSDGILGPSTASVLAAKMYEERMKHPHSMDTETSSQLLDPNRMALPKSATTHAGQLIQGNPGSISATLQQIQARNQQTADIKMEGNLNMPQRTLPMDPSSIYGQGLIQSKSALNVAGLNQGVSGFPLKGWPLTGIDQLRPNLGPQVQKPVISAPAQFQLLSPQQQQQFLAQAQVQGNLGSSSSSGDMDPQRFRTLPRGSLSGKEGQPTGTDGSIGSLIQSTSPKIRQDQAEYIMKIVQMQQSSSQKPQEHLQQQQQLEQNNRKRKQPSSSGAANSTGTGNTLGHSPNSPSSTPFTHTIGDRVGMAGNLHHVSSMPKSSMMYGADGPGLASSSNQMDDLENFGDVASLEDNVESFLSHVDGDARDIFAALKKGPSDQNQGSSKGFTFTEVNCIRTSNSKVVCCHFSSDGKFLASAGHEMKAVLWNMDTYKTESTPEEHSLIITDVRFMPNSTRLATSSFDRHVKLWDATQGGTVQVRFQPNVGQLLAAAAENVVSIFDVETDRKKHTWQLHKKDVQSVCWDNTGELLASVSQDCVKVWSLAKGECIHELSSNGNKFHSCIFHPSYANLLVIGGYQTLVLWNMGENQTMSVQAHDGLIAALAESPAAGMVASASHDKSVKLWK